MVYFTDYQQILRTCLGFLNSFYNYTVLKTPINPSMLNLKIMTRLQKHLGMTTLQSIVNWTLNGIYLMRERLF